MVGKKETFKNLYRSETNRVLAGVSGGLGEYFQIDPTLIRLLFVLLTVFGGGGVLVYIILWILIPGESNVDNDSDENIKKNAQEFKTKAKNFAEGFKEMSNKNHHRSWFGFIVIILGLLFLMDNLGFLRFHLFWPVLLIAFGLFLLFR